MTKTHGLLIAALVAGCTMDYKLVDIPPDDPDEEALLCPDMCADAIDAGCTRIACGVDIEDDYELGVNGIVIHLDGGGSCELVAECPTPSECRDDYVDCLEGSGSPEVCNAEYEECERALACDQVDDQCITECDDALEECEEHTPELDCEGDHQICRQTCDCLHDDCLSEETHDCVPTAAMMIAPPVKTGPFAWAVSRAFLDQQVARFGALAAETATWPVLRADRTAWRGVRLASIDPGEPTALVGLRDDDVLRAIAGVPVIDAMSRPHWLQTLRDRPTLVLRIERAGVIRDLTYTLTP